MPVVTFLDVLIFFNSSSGETPDSLANMKTKQMKQIRNPVVVKIRFLCSLKFLGLINELLAYIVSLLTNEYVRYEYVDSFCLVVLLSNTNVHAEKYS